MASVENNAVLKKLAKIQQELKAPKGQYNSFGKYKYRSCEDILEAVKPLLEAQKCTMVIKDDLVNIGNRYYVKAEVCLFDAESGESVSNTAYAREEESKKGQDSSQITGTASSYARKYALNGLFLIDDTKDADTDEFTKKTKMVNKTQIKLLEELANDDQKKVILEHYGIKDYSELTEQQAQGTIGQLRGKQG